MELQFNKNILTGAGIGMLLLLLVGFLFQGMSEEVLCRSYFLVSLARKKGNIWMAVVVNAVAFGLLHISNPGLTVLSMVNLILFGIFASIYFVKRGSIWGIAAIHSIWNFAQGNIYGVLVSGMNFGTTIFTSTINEDMTIINGGTFGLEGGILTTIVLVAGCILLLMTKQKDIAVEEPAAVEEQVAE
jgi:membrane protease YdiL (CAAX protease family)